MIKHALVIVTYNRLALLKECVDAGLGQSIPYDRIIIVDNASTDGTEAYLRTFSENKTILVKRMERNIGGAGGFCEGLKAARECEARWITIIDDDAVLRPDFLKEIETVMTEWKGKAMAFAGVPLTDGLRIGHRRRVKRRLICTEKAVPAEEYRNNSFLCDIASFCGLVVSADLVDRIGYPESGFFIWYDDTEYCLRFRKLTPIVNCCRAIIDHKAPSGTSGMYTAGWKEYYGIRNRMITAGRHYGILTECYLAVKKEGRCLTDCAGLLKKGKPGSARKVFLMYQRGIRDGFCGRLGLREPYLPGAEIE